MATCRLIVNKALRKIGRLGAGREPRVADQTDALAALQGLYGSWVTAGAFGRLEDVIPLADCVAGENQRIIRNASVITVTLPEFVPGYCDPRPYGRERINGDDRSARPPRDGAVIQLKDTNGGQVETHIYDGTLRGWARVDRLQLDDEAPRSAADPEGLSAALALELADDFGAEIGPTTTGQARRYIGAMTHSFSTPRATARGAYY